MKKSVWRLRKNATVKWIANNCTYILIINVCYTYHTSIVLLWLSNIYIFLFYAMNTHPIFGTTPIPDSVNIEKNYNHNKKQKI